MSKKSSTIVGVVKTVAPKSLVVVVSRKVKNWLGRYVACSTKMHVHDENMDAKVGDHVAIVPCKPYSKQKTWMLHEIISSKKIEKEAV